MQIVAVQHHLRLIVGLRAGERGVHVQILRPGVVGAELQAVAKAVAHVHLQRVVAAVAFGVPEESRAQIGIGASWPRAGNILRALRHDGLPAAPCAARGTAGRIGTNLRGNGVGIDAQQAVISELADIGHAQHRVVSSVAARP